MQMPISAIIHREAFEDSGYPHLYPSCVAALPEPPPASLASTSTLAPDHRAPLTRPWYHPGGEEAGSPNSLNVSYSLFNTQLRVTVTK